MGEAELTKDPTEKNLKQFSGDLKRTGFELPDDIRKQLIDKIKNIINTKVHHTGKKNLNNYSEILSKTLHKDYSYVSVFFKLEFIAIEKFIINQKIEKVKELII